jgi:hypothetical protein
LNQEAIDEINEKISGAEVIGVGEIEHGNRSTFAVCLDNRIGLAFIPFMHDTGPSMTVVLIDVKNMK